MIIVTGATGHIGNNIVRYLLSKKLDVKILIRQTNASLEGLSCDQKVSSFFDDVFLNEHIQSHDVIIHCAAHIDLMNKDMMTSFRTNLQLTKRLVKIAKQKDCRFVYLSTVDVIPKSKNGLIKEPTNLKRKAYKSYYKASKTAATHHVLKSINQGLNGVILYPSAAIGIHDYKPSAAGKEILNVLHHKILFSLRGGYNFIDVEDIAKAVYQAVLSSCNEQIILSGRNITIRELYAMIEKIIQDNRWVIPLPIPLIRFAILFSKRYSQMMISTVQENYQYDNSRMINLLNIYPTPFEETLKKTINWLIKNH